ncbi:hypothetical protein RvY_18936 [Ramazzottius varieornatus]|uniref:GDP-D-glucose phosphorylase 1 n=1 Tax=Ramazzottius varieornatus TaxID=947166 RepID=A0A1D1W7L5_RAMVA|nr:hypothetical protein RvY_18936 [Ramazzottius varieornatus]
MTIMLSARDHNGRCWNHRLGRFRRYSLPEPDVDDTSAILRKRKVSDRSDSAQRDAKSQAFSSSVWSHMMLSDEAKEFLYTPADFVWFMTYSDYVFNAEARWTKFDKLLQSTWRSAHDCEGVFRYELNKLETKVLSGDYGFVAQLNAKRAQERRPPEVMASMSVPFNHDKFNFTKIKPQEVLFTLKESQQVKEDKSNGDFVIANISPLEFCHVLLVPKLYLCRPQILTLDALRIALHSILLSGSWKLRVGFNSMGALASVNHLHAHAYYIAHNLPTETLPALPLAGPCHTVSKYPASGFVLQFPPLDRRKPESLSDELELFVQDVHGFIHQLQVNEIPHNLFITRGTPLYADMSRKNLVIRVYIWTREFSYTQKDQTAFNAALCELSGHLPIKNEPAFGTVTERDVCRVLHDVTQEMFLKAKPLASKHFTSPNP